MSYRSLFAYTIGAREFVGPSLEGYSFGSLPVCGGTTIVFSGHYFYGTVETISLTINGVACEIVSLDDDQHITVITPMGAAYNVAYDVTITTPYGSDTVVGFLTYNASPLTFASCTPNHGDSTGTTSVTLVGTGFLGVSSVEIEPATLGISFTVVDDRHLTFDIDGPTLSGYSGETLDFYIVRSSLSDNLYVTAPFVFDIIDASTLSPDIWFKGPYAGSPWSPTTPGDTHGNLVGNATAPSVLSPGVNGIDAASLNGTTQSFKLSTAYNVYSSAPTGFTVVAFVQLGTLAADAANFYDEPPVFTDETGNWGIVATASGVRAGIWNGAPAHTTRIALAAGEWAMVAMRYTSTGAGTLKCRVSQLSGTTDQTNAAAGAIAGVGAELRLGKNYAGTVFLPFDTVEALGWQRVLSDAELDNLRYYFNSVYNQGLT